MAASVAGRSTILRTLRRASANSVLRRSSLTVTSRISSHIPRRTPIAYPPPLRLVRRELSSFRPVHSAIASACLVSKLPTKAITSFEGRFANYLSPI